MKNILIILAAIALAGCNSVYVKPNTMEPGEVVFAQSGGWQMRKSAKQELERAGFKITMGKTLRMTDVGSSDVEIIDIPKDARYVMKVREGKEWFNPIWCPFNGFWFWKFNMSIADQKTGEEILAWSGRGCADSSLSKLKHIIQDLEKK